MKLEYDPYVKAAYLKLRDGVADETEEISPNIFMDIDAEGHVIGFEFLNPEQDFDQLPPVVEIQIAQHPPRTLAEIEEQSAG